MVSPYPFQGTESSPLNDFIASFQEDGVFDSNRPTSFSLSDFSVRKLIIMQIFLTRVCPGPSPEEGAMVESTFYAEMLEDTKISPLQKELLSNLKASYITALGLPPLAPR